jgi:hypothetical protein
MTGTRKRIGKTNGNVNKRKKKQNKETNDNKNLSRKYWLS